MIYDANFLAPFRKRPRDRHAAAAPAEKTTEMDFSRYAGQLRPWTYRDSAVLLEIEQALIDELDRAKAKEEEIPHDDHGARPH